MIWRYKTEGCPEGNNRQEGLDPATWCPEIHCLKENTPESLLSWICHKRKGEPSTLLVFWGHLHANIDVWAIKHAGHLGDWKGARGASLISQMALFLLIFASLRNFQDKDDFKSLTSLLSFCFSFNVLSTT